MQFAIFMAYRADKMRHRDRLLDAHREYIRAVNDSFLCAGVLTDDAGDIVGSLMVIEAKDRTALDRWLSREPFVANGLYGDIRVTRYENKWPREGRPPVRHQLYCAYTINDPEKADVRKQVQDDHRAYLAENEATIFAAGPLLGNDGEERLGVLYVVDVPDADSAAKWLAAEPYFANGGFQEHWLGPYINRFPE